MKGKATLPNLIIEQGQTKSNALAFNDLRFVTSLVLSAPEALTGTVTVEVTGRRNPAETDWKNLTTGGSVVTASAGEGLPITDVAFAGFRLVSDSAEAEKRTFVVSGRE